MLYPLSYAHARRESNPRPCISSRIRSQCRPQDSNLQHPRPRRGASANWARTAKP